MEAKGFKGGETEGYLKFIRERIDYWIKQVKEKAINVSPGAVLKELPYFIYYVPSMEGMIAFTKDLAQKMGDDGIGGR